MKAIFNNVNGSCTIEGIVPNIITCEYNAMSKTLLVARDRFGVQTLYYAQLPTSVIVSTALKDILPHIAYPKINMLNLAQPIRYNFPIDLQQTWIDQIKRVRAGEELTIDCHGIRSRIYWKRDHTPTFNGTKDEALAEALRLLRKSVKECVETTEGPVAVLLSGGIDSTSLAALTKEVQGEVHVFCAGYRGNKQTAMDERPIAKRFAEEKGLIYHEVELDVNDFQSNLTELIPYLDEPCFDVNCMVQYALFKHISLMGFKTIISGLGGDEQFYSYAAEQRIVRILQTRKEFIHLYPAREHRIEYIKFLWHHWKHLLWPTDAAIISEQNPVTWTYNDYRKFAQNAKLHFMNSTECFSDIDVAYRYPEDTNIISHYDFLFSTFANTLCLYITNKLSEANNINACYPLLNVELVTFLDSLPLDMKFDMNIPKRFQKELMKGIVPDYILYAKKRGFTPPFEFIRAIAAKYQYKQIQSDHCFFNSMVADMMIDNLLGK